MKRFDLCPEVSKAQAVRIADVVVIGPLMVAGAAALTKQGNKGAGALLAVAGLGTMIYNAGNYAQTKAAND